MGIDHSVSFYGFVDAISETLDLGAPTLVDHHKKVAYISWRIAQKLCLPESEIQDIVLAAKLHDIGAFSLEDRVRALLRESSDRLSYYASLGAKLLAGFQPLAQAAKLICFHHAPYDPSHDVPLGSYIINLAFRVSLLIDDQSEILGQVRDIVSLVSASAHNYHPKVLAAFHNLAREDFFWIEVSDAVIHSALLKRINFAQESFSIETLTSFARVICGLIDFRSPFTSSHSNGVAAVATEMARLSGFSDHQCELITISGWLHDLGKITVPNRILEKPTRLNAEEFNIVKRHAYYTYAVLGSIHGLENIAVWASHHHERMDGSGYPFGASGIEFNPLSQTMACADMFTAMAEDRPYRLGLSKDVIIGNLNHIAERGSISPEIVSIATREYNHLNEIRINAQCESQKAYYRLFQENGSSG
ncbi:MAG: HD domain-containing protein [Coriobacteriia bacterium]|nr:HD domain-containing protein [Coriobacteriia bacterium]